MSELRTDRLLLRPFAPADAPWVYDVLSRPEVKRWMEDDFEHPKVMASVDAAQAKIDGDWARHFTKPPRGYWAVVPDGGATPVAAICLVDLPNAEHGEVEIGWWAHPDATGHGYVSEAAAAVLAHGFAGGLEEVWAVMWPDNAPSAAVARRLGMTEIGEREVPWYPPPTLLWKIRAQDS